MIAGFRTRENGRRVESCPCKPGLPYTYFSGWFPNPGLTRFSYSGFSSFFTRVQDKQRDRRQRQKLDQRSYAQRLLLRLLPEGFSSSSLPSAKCFYTSRSKHARGSFPNLRSGFLVFSRELDSSFPKGKENEPAVLFFEDSISSISSFREFSLTLEMFKHNSLAFSTISSSI